MSSITGISLSLTLIQNSNTSGGASRTTSSGTTTGAAACSCGTCASCQSNSSSTSTSSNATQAGNPARGTDTFQSSGAGSAKGAAPGAGGSGNGKQLSASQENQVDALKKVDAAVHAHEQAHLAAAGGYARSGAIYEFKTGPDGKQYAVGGHVNIDASPIANDPKATISKERVVQRAALAPADPSAQDRSVASQAAAEIAKAQQEESAENKQPGGANSKASDDSTGQDNTTSTQPAKSTTTQSGSGLPTSGSQFRSGRAAKAYAQSTNSSSNILSGVVDLVG